MKFDKDGLQLDRVEVAAVMTSFVLAMLLTWGAIKLFAAGYIFPRRPTATHVR
jgi:hypothetical protein